MNTFHAIGAMKSASLATVAPASPKPSSPRLWAFSWLSRRPSATTRSTEALGVLETRLVNFAGMFLNRVQRELNAHRAVSRSGQAE